jgi:hypothetical protein
MPKRAAQLRDEASRARREHRLDDARRDLTAAVGREDAATLDLANAIRPLAILKETTGDAAAARRLWEEARDLYAAAGIAAGVTECTARLARLDA